MKFFIIRFPNKEEILYKCNSWYGMTKITPYFDTSQGHYITMTPVKWYEAIKFMFGIRIVKD